MSDIDAQGYMPLNQEFAFDDTGYQPLNEQFDWNYGQDEFDPYSTEETDNALLEQRGWVHMGGGEWSNSEAQEYGAFQGGQFVNTTKGIKWDRAGQPIPWDEHGGYQKFGAEFEFDATDLEDDPGYQWRLDQGNKGVERSAAASGMLQSGKTLERVAAVVSGPSVTRVP